MKAFRMFLAAVLTSAAASASLAATSLGTLIPGGNPATASFQKTFTSTGVFTEDYTFSISPGGALVGIAASTEIALSAFPLPPMAGIDKFKIELFDGAMSSLGAGTTVSSGALSCGPGITCETQTAVLSMSPLLAGSYLLRVTGDVIGTGGGSYGGSLSVAAVPEPHEWVMMLAGLGMVGVIASRRRGAQSA